MGVSPDGRVTSLGPRSGAMGDDMTNAAQRTADGPAPNGPSDDRRLFLLQRAQSPVTRPVAVAYPWLPFRTGAQATALARADPSTRANLVAGLQRTRGNGYVQRLVTDARRAGFSPVRATIQRCGATPCGSTDEEQAPRDAPGAVHRSPIGSPIRRDEGDDEPQTGGGSLLDAVVDTVSGVVGSGSGAVAGVSEGAGQVAEAVAGVTAAAGGVAASAGGAVASGIGSVAEGASQVASGASQLAGEAADTVSEGIGTVGEAAGGIVGGIVGGITGVGAGTTGDGQGGAAAGADAAEVAGRKDEGRGEDAFCKPFSDGFRTLTVLGEMNLIVPPLMSGAFGSGVAALWTQFIKGGAAPQTIADPEIIDSFAESSTSTDAAEQIADAAKQAVEAQPALPDGVHDLEKLVDPGRRATIGRAMDFNNPFSKAGNIAGGVSTPPQTSAPIGHLPGPVDDSRSPEGSAVVRTQTDGTRSVLARPRFTVVDTVDFCPGGAGAFIEQSLTVPLSQLEASGVSGDVPFTIKYGTPALTRTAGKPATR
jgi:X-X-X-Leu-X-X-Gly heptad repeat protein